MGGNGSSGSTAQKRPNERLGSWFVRSGWSKGELARQVNRQARQMGAHHVSTDTSRVRRWLDGEQPREPIPQILSGLFSERFGRVVAIEDLGLRPARQPASGSSVDLPWTGPQTVTMINEFSRSDLMLGRSGFLGSSLAMSAGTSLIEPMQRWLVPGPSGREPVLGARGSGHTPAHSGPPPAGGRAPSGHRRRRISQPEVQQLEETTEIFRRWDAQCGGGLRRKAVVGQLHEVTDLLLDTHPQPVAQRLFRVTAELAELAGWMSYDVGLQPTAQKYYVLALHAAKEAGDRPLGSYILANMGRQMIHLGRPEDALELIQLGQYGSRDGATPRTQAMLYAMEARAYANMSRPSKCHRAVRMAEDTFADIAPDDGDPDWIRFFSEAELHAENAHSYRDLAYGNDRSSSYASLAEPVIQRAVQMFAEEVGKEGGHHRSYALNLAGLASVHLLQEQPEECAAVAGRAMDVAKQLRSERVATRIRKTSALAFRRFGQVPEIAQLAERLVTDLPVPEIRHAV